MMFSVIMCQHLSSLPIYLSDQVLMCCSLVKVPPARVSPQDEINTKFNALNYFVPVMFIAQLSGKSFWRTITIYFETLVLFPHLLYWLFVHPHKCQTALRWLSIIMTSLNVHILHKLWIHWYRYWHHYWVSYCALVLICLLHKRCITNTDSRTRRSNICKTKWNAVKRKMQYYCISTCQHETFVTVRYALQNTSWFNAEFNALVDAMSCDACLTI